jgi:hypothetical protein
MDKALLGKMIALLLFESSPPYMESKGSLLCPHEPSTPPYPNRQKIYLTHILLLSEPG